MALTRNETQLTWAAASSVTLSNANIIASDAITFDATDVKGSIMVSADNAGIPASGDIIEVWAAYTCGDVLGDSGDDYETDEHAWYLGVLDTFGSNTPGEAPARRSFPVDVAGRKGMKLLVKAPLAATSNIVIRARLHTQRAA